MGYDGGCYLFETNAVAWSIARNNCTDTPDSDLLVINNSDELEYIKNRITSGIWWIGKFGTKDLCETRASALDSASGSILSSEAQTKHVRQASAIVKTTAGPS